MHGNLRKWRHDHHIRRHDAQDASKVSRTVCTDLEHKHLRIYIREHEERCRPLNEREPCHRIVPRIVHAEDSERHAEFTIETLLAFAYRKSRRENCGDRILGRRLPYRARHHHDMRPIAPDDKPRKQREQDGNEEFKEVFHREVVEAVPDCADRPRSGGTW